MKLLFILALLILSGCVGETNCPSYPHNNLNWIPYSGNSVTKFTDGIDTVQFIVDVSFSSDEYSIKNNCKCSCEANAYFRTKINDEINYKIEGQSYYYGESVYYGYSFVKYGYSGQNYSALSSDDFRFGYENGKLTHDILPEFLVGGKIYKDVIKLELDTTDDHTLNWRKPEIWRLMIADSVGIIQFDESKTQKVWRIIE